MSSKEVRTCRVTVVMAETLKGTIQDLADEADRSVSDFIRLVLKEYVEALAGQLMVEDDEEEEESLVVPVMPA